MQPPDIAKPWSNIETTFLRGPPTPQDNRAIPRRVLPALPPIYFKASPPPPLSVIELFPVEFSPPIAPYMHRATLKSRGS